MVLLPTARTYLNIRVALIAFAAIVLVLGAVLIMVQRLLIRQGATHIALPM